MCAHGWKEEQEENARAIETGNEGWKSLSPKPNDLKPEWKKNGSSPTSRAACISLASSLRLMLRRRRNSVDRIEKWWYGRRTSSAAAGFATSRLREECGSQPGSPLYALCSWLFHLFSLSLSVPESPCRPCIRAPPFIRTGANRFGTREVQ